MKRTLLIAYLLGWAAMGGAQTRAQTLSWSAVLHLPDADHVSLPVPGGALSVPLGPGDIIRLVPPDMAALAPAGVLSVETDTFPQGNGPARCLSRCLVDTLFLGDGLFLTGVEIEVPFFEDGTYEGASSFGIETLNQLGQVGQPIPLPSGGAELRIVSVEAGRQTMLGRRLSLEQLQPGPAFPLAQGDLQEIRLIRGNDRPATRIAMEVLLLALLANPHFCQDPTADPAIPPQKALDRLPKPYTVRFFEPAHAMRAEALAEVVAYFFQVPRSQVAVEDMLPAYQGQPPLRDYLEIWVK